MDGYPSTFTRSIKVIILKLNAIIDEEMGGLEFYEVFKKTNKNCRLMRNYCLLLFLGHHQNAIGLFSFGSFSTFPSAYQQFRSGALEAAMQPGICSCLWRFWWSCFLRSFMAIHRQKIAPILLVHYPCKRSGGIMHYNVLGCSIRMNASFTNQSSHGYG